eukprot:TRINITY_DN10186_c0_g1_i3.p1 TRINITY_DN10186_c0_g1~~TRINITY_DN10186_c0_g1_i3.p1  ORF type:complete len:351 (-),score=3.23 TRINITY_DN10186_c0_g1_i3:40-1092(-)
MGRRVHGDYADVFNFQFRVYEYDSSSKKFECKPYGSFPKPIHLFDGGVAGVFILYGEDFNIPKLLNGVNGGLHDDIEATYMSENKKDTKSESQKVCAKCKSDMEIEVQKETSNLCSECSRKWTKCSACLEFCEKKQIKVFKECKHEVCPKCFELGKYYCVVKDCVSEYFVVPTTKNEEIETQTEKRQPRMITCRGCNKRIEKPSSAEQSAIYKCSNCKQELCNRHDDVYSFCHCSCRKCGESLPRGTYYDECSKCRKESENSWFSNSTSLSKKELCFVCDYDYTEPQAKHCRKCSKSCMACLVAYGTPSSLMKMGKCKHMICLRCYTNSNIISKMIDEEEEDICIACLSQ